MNRTDERFKKLQQTLKKQGAFKKDTHAPVWQALLFVSLTIVGIWLLDDSDELISQAFAFWLIVLSGLGISTLGHTAGHGGVSSKSWLNKLLVYFSYPFFLQVSRHFWHNKHSTHHQVPNILGKDGDVDLFPYVALTKEQYESIKGWKKCYYKYQWYFFPIILSGNSFGVIRNSWKYLITILLDTSQRKPAHFLDLGLLLLHIAVWYVIPSFFVSVGDVILFNVIRLVGISYGMYALFAPAHMTRDTILLDKEIDTSDMMALQTYTVINYRTGWIGRLICNGVEYQLEHHLFPLISHTKYPEISKTVEKFCKDNGYPYRSERWGVAVWRSWMALKDLKTSYEYFPALHDLPGYEIENEMNWSTPAKVNYG